VADLEFANAKTLSYSRLDNDLIVFADEDEITVKNYFSNKTGSTLSINGNAISYTQAKTGKTLTNTFDGSELAFDTSYLGTKYNDIITTGAGNDEIDSGKGNDIVNAGSGNNILTYTTGSDKFFAGDGNDTYNVAFGKNTDLVISDSGGSDVLNLTGKNLTSDDLALLFNVDKGGAICSDSSLVIVDKKAKASKLTGLANGTKVSGVVEIKNYFSQTSDESTAIKGAIESIRVGADVDTARTWNLDIESIASAVANWLTSKNYADSMAVFESGNTSDMSALLGVYTTGINTQITPASKTI
jgi:hypothetical protein